MSAVPSRIHEEKFSDESLCWTDKRGSVFLSRLFNRFDGEYTEGATKKHRPKERCRVLDKNDTIKMRNQGFLKGSYKLYSTIYKLFFISFFFQNRSRRTSRSSKNSSTYPVIQKHSRRQLPAVPCSVSTVCCKTNRHETGDN